jgi:hypothetical protein
LGELQARHELVEFLSLSNLVSLNLISQTGWWQTHMAQKQLLGLWKLLSAYLDDAISIT